MRIEYLQCAPGERNVRWGTIFVWFPKKMSSEDRNRVRFVRQTIKDLSLCSDPIYQAVDHERDLTLQGFWADIPADKWQVVLATLAFNGRDGDFQHGGLIQAAEIG